MFPFAAQAGEKFREDSLITSLYASAIYLHQEFTLRCGVIGDDVLAVGMCQR
jgi:hypothetical protein